MFVGFIAVVVILLVIVGLMSSGATSGSGGVDQTKATKAIGELSGLAQSAGFYKTTTASSDYADISTANLVSNGIVATTDTYTITAADVTAANFVGETAVVANDVLVKSKAVEGLYYQVIQAVDTPSAMKVNIVVDNTAITANGTLANALESSYSKLGATSADILPTGATDAAKLVGDGDSTNNVLDTTAGNGAATLYFR